VIVEPFARSQEKRHIDDGRQLAAPGKAAAMAGRFAGGRINGRRAASITDTVLSQ
jgi:hypothetical protein